MSLDAKTLAAVADRVQHAQDHAHTLAKLTDDHPSMSIEDGYAVQEELLHRWTARGDRLVGHKAGLTSKAKMQQMGVHVPSFGLLMASYAQSSGAATLPARRSRPRWTSTDDRP